MRGAIRDPVAFAAAVVRQRQSEITQLEQRQLYPQGGSGAQLELALLAARARLKEAQAEYQQAGHNRMMQLGAPYPVVLRVPYSQKDEAARLGATWDRALKSWVCPANKPLQPFAAWVPTHR